MPSGIESFVDSGGIISTGVESTTNITSTTAIVSGENIITSTTSSISGASPLSELPDVDVVTEGRLDGSVLVYNTASNKWVSTTTLEKQTMNAGFF